MKNSARTTSTQAFTDILDIRENIVLLRGGAACIILRLSSVNFALLSAEEQDAKVFAYASLLNSLSFPIQILIRSKPVQIAPYLDSLAVLAEKTPNQQLKVYMQKYKDFVAGLVQSTTVLDKQFYLVISYSSLEAGAAGLIKGAAQNDTSLDQLFQQAQTGLKTKADSLLSQISRLSLQATILEKETLMKLFYDIYNQGDSFTMTNADIATPMVKGAL